MPASRLSSNRPNKPDCKSRKSLRRLPALPYSRASGPAWPWPAAAASSAGPTGVPWVDPNSWKIRLEARAAPASTSGWTRAPKGARVSASSYRTAIADAAAHGGRWVISLDAQLAAGIADSNPNALATWKEITGAAGFFSQRKPWPPTFPKPSWASFPTSPATTSSWARNSST